MVSRSRMPQPSCTGIEPVPRHRARIFGEHRGGVHFALLQAHTMTVLEVDGGDQQHTGSDFLNGKETWAGLNQGAHWTKFASRRRPAAALFSGWNWTAKILAR